LHPEWLRLHSDVRKLSCELAAKFPVRGGSFPIQKPGLREQKSSDTNSPEPTSLAGTSSEPSGEAGIKGVAALHAAHEKRRVEGAFDILQSSTCQKRQQSAFSWQLQASGGRDDFNGVDGLSSQAVR